MSNETKTNRTQLTDLPIAEQEMTAEEMAKVQGGKLQVPAQPQVTTAPSTPVPIEPPIPGKPSKEQ